MSRLSMPQAPSVLPRPRLAGLRGAPRVPASWRRGSPVPPAGELDPSNERRLYRKCRAAECFPFKCSTPLFKPCDSGTDLNGLPRRQGTEQLAFFLRLAAECTENFPEVFRADCSGEPSAQKRWRNRRFSVPIAQKSKVPDVSSMR